MNLPFQTCHIAINATLAEALAIHGTVHFEHIPCQSAYANPVAWPRVHSDPARLGKIML